MKFTSIVGSITLLALASTLRADVILGAVETEPGVPIVGEADVAIYNLTGPTFGCSTSAGTSICTPVTFDNVVLTINGLTELPLGDIGPGLTETLSYSNGIFADGSISSLSLTLSLSTTSFIDDLSQSYIVAPNITLFDVPIDGSPALISATSSVPEPAMFPILLAAPFLLFALIFRKEQNTNLR